MLRHARGSTREFIHRKYLSQVTLGRTHPRHLSLKTCVHVPTFTVPFSNGSGPKPVGREDWIATHVLDFFNEISIVYGTVAEQCTITTCACMSAGPRYTYKWADGNVVTTPIKLPASEYIRLLLEWVQEQIENTQLFPVSPASSSTSSTSSEPPAYPQPDFDRTVQHIFKRLFRVYAHVYHSHYPYICSINADRALNACFARFCWFIHVWELVDARQLAPLKDVMDEIMLKSDGGRRGKGGSSSPTGRTNKP